MTLKVNFTSDGSRNVAVHACGVLKPNDEDRLFLCEFKDRNLKLTSVLFLIQEKAGLSLWWDKEGQNLVLPLESRGAFKFENGLKAPEQWGGKLWMTPFKVDEDKSILLLLEFDK